MQENIDTVTWKSRDIAEGIGISSRGVAGTLRKMVNDGFVEKMGENPAVYTLTEKGKNFIID
jgi:predicted transcriptional regulator